ncbi:hypothetical protein RJ640_028952 [Escallonia rubra]|uniref:Uncharacterized protein n=1 Tax=Escallonia rubra TaxID=112253 RepID=A0AA88R7B8_9ASTE|nr:hypothetical protein RJ640_028952 [Escallonia rubra]
MASSAPLTMRHWATETTPRGVEPREAQEGSLNHNSLPLPVPVTFLEVYRNPQQHNLHGNLHKIPKSSLGFLFI